MCVYCLLGCCPGQVSKGLQGVNHKTEKETKRENERNCIWHPSVEGQSHLCGWPPRDSSETTAAGGKGDIRQLPLAFLLPCLFPLCLNIVGTDVQTIVKWSNERREIHTERDLQYFCTKLYISIVKCCTPVSITVYTCFWTCFLYAFTCTSQCSGSGSGGSGINWPPGSGSIFFSMAR